MNISIHSVIEPLQSIGCDLISFFPKIIAAFAVITAGIMVSWAMKKFSLLICSILKLDKKLSDIWIFRIWSREKSRHIPSKALSNFVYYFFLFIAVLFSVKILGGKISDMILDSLFEVIPGMLSFMLILFLGSLLAMFFSFIAQIMFMTSGFKYPSFWGKVVAWSTFGVTAVFSLERLGIAGKLLSFIAILILSIAGITLAIAFGIGCKDLAREFIIELLKKNKNGNTKQ